MIRPWWILLAMLALLGVGWTTAFASPVLNGQVVERPVVSADWGGRLQSGFGAVLILALAVLLSERRQAISRRVVVLGLAMQLGLAVVLIQVPLGRRVLAALSSMVVAVLDCALAGSSFVFGPELTRPDGPAGFVFAFRVLPTVIFVAALFAVLYQLGIMQRVVRAFAWVMARLLGTSGAESLNVAASIFLGQTEAPLTIRPYLLGLTRSELLTVMVSGMALVSGGVLGAYIGAGAEPRDLLTAILMNAPGAILMAKILVPETGTPETLGLVRGDAMERDTNVLDAAARGTREGLHLALNIAAILITFIGLITLLDLILGAGGAWIEGLVGRDLGLSGWSLAKLLGTLLAPVAWLLGVGWTDAPAVGGLLGTRLVLNELVAYGHLGELASHLEGRSYTIATFALCGFANISSVGIQLGGIGALVPERRGDLARLGVRALLAATLANFLSACLAGIVL
ncbi:nucleoside transporter [soil metagenome]